jgi:hypothetical protein
LLRCFELGVAAPMVVRLALRELGPGELLRFARSMIRWRVPPAPVLPAHWSSAQRRLAWAQFSSALRLHQALTHSVGECVRRDELYERMIAEIGARFVGRLLSLPSPQRWQSWTGSERSAFLTQAVRRFFNARVEHEQIGDEGLGFDVTACQFAELARAVGRPEMARAFCRADDIYFSRGDSPVTLRRSGTIASGASSCDFRFSSAGEGLREP